MRTEGNSHQYSIDSQNCSNLTHNSHSISASKSTKSNHLKANSIVPITLVIDKNQSDENTVATIAIPDDRRSHQTLKRRLSAMFVVAGIQTGVNESYNAQLLWNAMNTTVDAIIDYAEFRKYIQNLIKIFQNKGNSETLTHIEVRLAEYIISMMRSSPLDNIVIAIFNELDRNGSGKITQLEFVNGIVKIGILEHNFIAHGRPRQFNENSLCIFGIKSRVRQCAVWVITWKWFDRFILGCIIVNSVVLGLRDYNDPGLIPNKDGLFFENQINLAVNRLENFFSYIFVVESGVKILAMGFIFGRGSYLRSYWNMLDFLVVILGLIDDIPGIPKVSALRVARVLRPLRTLSNLQGMRVLVYALLNSIPALFNVMVILVFIFTVFGILGVLFWNGALHYRCRQTPKPIDGVWPLAGVGHLCGGAYMCPRDEFCGSPYDAPSDSYIDWNKLTLVENWDYKFANFDHIGLAVLTLFQCITLEGWTEVMYNYQDAFNWAFATTYFVIFTLIGAFFLIQFVFAVIWDRFEAQNDITVGDSVGLLALSTQVQKIKLKKLKGKSRSLSILLTSTYVAVKTNDPVYRIQELCKWLTETKKKEFENFIVVCILLNTTILAMDEYPGDPTKEGILEALGYVLTVVFTFEMVIKLISSGWTTYSKSYFNLFDGVIVLLSLIELLVGIFNTSQSRYGGLSALRSFRLFRIIKLAKSWTSLNELISTISNSVRDVANFGLLLLLLMYVFALVGMQFFATKYRFNSDGEPVVWQPHVYSNTTPPHAPWTPELPYSIRRSNFDDTLAAFTTVFQCLTEENWNAVMYDGIRSTGWIAVVYFVCLMAIGNIVVLNLFLAILLGNFGGEQQQEDVQPATELDHIAIKDSVLRMRSKFDSYLTVGTKSDNTKPPIVGDVNIELSLNKTENILHVPCKENSFSMMKLSHSPPMKVAGNAGRGRNSLVGSSQRIGNHRRLRRSSILSSRDEIDILVPDKRLSIPFGLIQTDGTALFNNQKVDIIPACHPDGDVPLNAILPWDTSLQLPNPQNPISTSVEANNKSSHQLSQQSQRKSIDLRNNSLFVFHKESRIRRLCNRIAHSTFFESGIFVVIFISSVELTLDNPLNDPLSQHYKVIKWIDLATTLVFMFEMIIKIVDTGFVWTKKGVDTGFIWSKKSAYLRDPWNVLDFSIVLASIVTLISESPTLRTLRSLRTLRALRPLRVISRFPGMKKVVNALLSSISCIMNVFLVCSLIFLIFGIIAVNLFKGRLYYCDMSTFSLEQLKTLEDSFGFTKLSFKKLFSQNDCITEGGIWKRRTRHYDNVIKAAMTLFEISTTEGWVNLMYEGVDTTEIGFHPVENYNRGYIAFFVAFIIIGSFFSLNLFVGAVIDNFNRMRDASDCRQPGDDTQYEWMQIQKMVNSMKPKAKSTPPKNCFRLICFKIEQHQYFDPFIILCVLGNTLMLSTIHINQSELFSRILGTGNLVFWFVFLLEAAIRLLSMGVRKYFRSGWNLFDFAIVCGSSVSTVFQLFSDGAVSPVANTFRAFRMGLAIRLVQRAQSMRDIINTILDNMPALVNVSTLLCLIMFVYGVIGVQLYAGVMLGDALNEHANFRDISHAMITLFRFTTGEAWNDIMYKLMIQPISGEDYFPNGKSCNPEWTYADLELARQTNGNPNLTIGCGPSPSVTYIYFLTYMLITTYVLVNLFVAVILEGFEETTEKHLTEVKKEDLDLLLKIWNKYDDYGLGYLSDHTFIKFLQELPPPLGLPPGTERKQVLEYAYELDLEIDKLGIGLIAFAISASYRLMQNVAADRGEDILPPEDECRTFFARSQQLFHRKLNPRKARNSFATLKTTLAVKRIQALARKRAAKLQYQALQQQKQTDLDKSEPTDSRTDEKVDEIAAKTPNGSIL